MAPFRLADGAWLNTPSEQVSLVQPVAVTANTASAVTSQEELSFRLNQIELGQQLVAQVQTRLSDGSYLVRVADTVAQMQLPANVQTGENISITLIEKTPRPTFLFNGETPAATTGSSVMTLSNTGRMISNLMANTATETSPTISSPLPVSLQPPTSPADFAHALQQTVNQSGLFYEAHLQEWTQGQVPLTQIRQEPQAVINQQLVTSPPQEPATTGVSAAPTQTALTGPATHSAAPLPPQSATLPMVSADPVIPGNPASPPNTPVQSLQHLVQTQLQTLEQNRFVWQGTLWPGQTAEWEVARDDPQQESQATPQQVWTSRLRLQLPTLGEVTADLRLQNGHLQVRLQGTSVDAVRRLRNDQSALAQGMQIAGLQLDSLLVEPSSMSSVKPGVNHG